ncbi:MAG: hypothetical protein AAF447_10045 [Myxococcota bacterium]
MRDRDGCIVDCDCFLDADTGPSDMRADGPTRTDGGTSPDAGTPPDAGPGCPECPVRELSWSSIGGLRVAQARLLLTGCERLESTLAALGGPERERICVEAVACDDAGEAPSSVRIAALLQDESVRRAFEDEVDLAGTGFQYTLTADGRTLSVGPGCIGCAPAPEPMRELLRELNRLEAALPCAL